MKNMKRVLIIAMSVCFLLLGSLSAVSAKNVQEGSSSVNLTYSVSDYLSMDVTSVTVDDADGIIKSVKITGASFSGQKGIQNGFDYSDRGSMESPNGPADGTITVKVTLNSSAKAGDSATVSLNGGYTNKNNEYAKKTWTQTVNVTKKGGSTTPTTKLDLTELKKQIGIAEGLNEKEYTSTSWKVLAGELSDGKAALKATTQAEVDKAAQELAAAIAQLVKMDWSKLQDAINKGNALIESEEMGDLWRDFLNAMNNGSLLLGSNDQDAVNAAADQILAALDALKAYLGLDDDAVIVKPGEEFCNISLHNLWPILFFISLAINALLGVLLVKGKKNKLNDNTPVVNYDISDDDK